jgi:hypothetical protein
MRRWVVTFSIVQLVGIASSWFWEHPHSAASSFLWGVGLFTLFPGNLLSTWGVQSLLWQSHLTLGVMSVIATVLCIVINAAVWFGAMKGLKLLHVYPSRRPTVPGRDAAK